MPRLIGGRMLKMAAMVLAIVVVNFLLIHAAPGDPASAIAGQSGQADVEFMQQLREQFGLDKPLPVQLWIYVQKVLTLDLGVSHRLQRPVLTVIFERLPATLLLTGTAFAIALSSGIALGVRAAHRPGGVADTIIMGVSLFFYATPLFLVGIVLVLVFGVWLNWLPTFGMETVDVPLQGLARIADVARHAVLPVVTLAVFYSAVYVRLTRASMIEVSSSSLHQDSARQGGHGKPHHLGACAPERIASRHHAGGYPSGASHRRLCSRGDGVRMAGDRQSRIRSLAGAGLRPAARHFPLHIGGRVDLQSSDGPSLSGIRSAG